MDRNSPDYLRESFSWKLPEEATRQWLEMAEKRNY